MIKILFELPGFLLSALPLLTSTAVFALLGVWLSGSIKKHPGLWYAAFALPFALVAIPSILRWFGVASFSLTGVPVLGQLLRDYIHMGTLGHPLLIVIMYMGALDTKRSWVKRLMAIRKELSILSGFPVLTHTLIRVTGNLPESFRYFADHDAFMASANLASDLGAGISHSGLILGVVLVALFVPLWITSFDGVHRRMGTVKWKKLQRWAYAFYAVMFIHAMGIQIGGMFNPRGGGEAPRAAVEQTVASSPAGEAVRGGERPQAAPRTEARPAGAQAAPQGGSGGRRQAKGFADFTVEAGVKRWLHIAELLLIYGSYLCLRVRKSRNRQKT